MRQALQLKLLKSSAVRFLAIDRLVQESLIDVIVALLCHKPPIRNR